MLRQAQQNGIFSIISKPPPFVLSSSKDSEGVFQQPVSLGRETDARGTYPLHVAAEFGQAGTARALLEYGADVSLLDSENEAVHADCFWRCDCDAIYGCVSLRATCPR
jgi:hypothetical protein